jgi:Ca-activated chloride channel family protein
MAKKKKKNTSFIQRFKSSKGSITFKILIAVVILGSIAFVSGIFPKGQISPIDPNGPKYKPITDGDTQNKKTLQLKTIKFEACSQTVAVEMVLDRSGSMQGKKLQDLKTASLFFVSKLTDDAPIGIVSFDSTVREDLPIQPYKDVKGRVETIIRGYNAGTNTYTRDAMIRAKQALEVGMPKFPGRQFALILVSDGLPNPADSQNPLLSPNVATDIKNMGVKIFTIGITQGLGGSSQQMRTLMGGIASPNSFFEAPDTNQLTDIYNKIGFEICNTAN